MTFADLHDALAGAGLRVGIALEGGRHVITVDDGAGRCVELAVAESFDRTAQALVAGMFLRECLGPMPESDAPGRRVRGRWPEFVAIAAQRAGTGRSGT